MIIFEYTVAFKGIKVLEFGGVTPVPFCGKVLRDLGARVIRIDKVIKIRILKKSFIIFIFNTHQSMARILTKIDYRMIKNQ